MSNRLSLHRADKPGSHSSVGFSIGSRSLSGNSSMSGAFDAQGNQTGGTRFDHDEGSATNHNWVWSKQEGLDHPTVKTLQRVTDASSNDSTLNLSDVSAGADTGSFTASASGSNEVENTQTVVGRENRFGPVPASGSYAPIVGWTDANDRSRTKDKVSRSVSVNLTMSAGPASGTVTTTDAASGDQAATTDRHVAKIQGTETAQISGSANGSFSLSETQTDTYPAGGGSPSSSRTFTLTQTQDAYRSESASGFFTNQTGGNGSWSGSDVARTKANDSAGGSSELQADGSWKQTSHTFSIDRKGEKTSEYHAQDWLSMSGGVTPVLHKIDRKQSQTSRQVESGSPNNHSFDIDVTREAKVHETTKGTTVMPNGDSLVKDIERLEVEANRDHKKGQSVNGVPSFDLFLEEKKVFRNFRTDNVTTTPWSTTVDHAISQHLWTYSKSGSITPTTGGSGSGTIHESVYIRAGATQTITTPGFWGGTTTYGSIPPAFNPPARNDTWGNYKPIEVPNYLQAYLQVYKDFSLLPVAAVSGVFSSSSAQVFHNLGEFYFSGAWAWERGRDLVQVAAGAVEVVIGVGMTGSGLGAVVGVTLVVVGTDQVLTGLANLISGKRRPSVLEAAGYGAARLVGFEEETARSIGHWTPAVLSLGATAGFGLARLGLTADFAIGAGTGRGLAVIGKPFRAGKFDVQVVEIAELAAAEFGTYAVIVGTRQGLRQAIWNSPDSIIVLVGHTLRPTNWRGRLVNYGSFEGYSARSLANLFRGMPETVSEIVLLSCFSGRRPLFGLLPSYGESLARRLGHSVTVRASVGVTRELTHPITSMPLGEIIVELQRGGILRGAARFRVIPAW